MRTTELPNKTSNQIAPSTDTIITNVGGEASQITYSNLAEALVTPPVFECGQSKKYKTFEAAKTAAEQLITSANIRGSEKVINGVPDSATSWTLGASWIYSSQHFVKNLDGIDTVEQDISTIPGEEYELIYTISSHTAGTIIPEIGGVKGNESFLDGTYTQTIKAITDEPLRFYPSYYSRLSISAISVKKIIKPVTISISVGDDGEPLPIIDNNGTPYDIHELEKAGIRIVTEKSGEDKLRFDNEIIAGTMQSRINQSRMQAQNNCIRYQHAAIAIMSDDSTSADYTLLTEYTTRNLPFGIAAQFHKLGVSGFMTLAQLQEAQDKGAEILQHYHGSDTQPELFRPINPTGITDFYYRAIQLPEEYKRKYGFNVQSWVQAGGETGEWNIDSRSKLNSEQVRLLENYYTMIRAYVFPPYKGQSLHPVPIPDRIGTYHTSIEQMTDTAVKTIIDDVIAYGGCSLLMYHGYHIGESGYMTLAQLQSVLDYIKTKRDADLISVLTPTGLLFAQKGNDINQLDDGDFALCSSAGGLSVFWRQGGSGASVTINDSGGAINNSHYITIPHNKYLRQLRIRPNARVFKLNFYAKCASQPKDLSVIINKCMTNTGNTRTFTISIDSTTWKKYSLHFGRNYLRPEVAGSTVDPGPYISFQNTSGSNIDLSNTELVEI